MMIIRYGLLFIFFLLSACSSANREWISISGCPEKTITEKDVRYILFRDSPKKLDSLDSCVLGAIESNSIPGTDMPFEAAQFNAVRVLRYLLDGGYISPNAVNSYGHSILGWSLMSGSYGAALELVKHGAIVDESDSDIRRGIDKAIKREVFINKEQMKSRDKFIDYLSARGGIYDK